MKSFLIFLFSCVAYATNYYQDANFKKTVTVTGDLNATKIGIGATPTVPIHLKGTTNMVIRNERVSSDASAAAISIFKARGSVGAESAISLNDALGGLYFWGFGSTTYGSSPTGMLTASAMEAFTDSAKGTRVVISTTPNGSVTPVSSFAIQDSTFVMGRGFSHASPSNVTLKGTDVVSGTSNTSSGDIVLQSGKSTGNASGGRIAFQISPSGSSGTTQNSQLDRMSLHSDGTIKFFSPDATKTLDLLVSNSATNHTYVFPLTQGTAGQVLTNDGSGGLSWATPSGGGGAPEGTISAFGGSSAPTGWLLCDGSTVSRTTYAALYAVIGDAYGNGDGSTTFHLPDLRGRFLRGVDSTAGNDPDAASRTASNSGGNTGDNVGSLQADQFASHSHSTVYGTGVTFGTYMLKTVGPPGGSLDTSAAGGNETRPKNVYVNYIIKY